MKNSPRTSMRRLLLATALSAGLGFVSPAFADETYIVDLNSKTVIDLGTLDGGYAISINDTGQVVGNSGTASGARHAFITGPNGVGMTDLGTLGGTESYASGINAAGQVVGYSDTASGASHAFITGPNGVGMRDLGTLGGPFSSVIGINAVGQVAGYYDTASGANHAFITGPNGVGVTDLGTLGGDSSYANGINDAGQVVGFFGPRYADPPANNDAFITGPNGVGITDLNSLVSLPGVNFNFAMAINNHGQVVVISVVPEPETYALLLAGLGLIGVVAQRRKLASTGPLKPLLQAT